jgi:hypothetical protein
MKTSFIVVLLMLLSFNSFAKDFKIEKDQVFKTLLSEFKNPGTNLALYQESENYRLDLTIVDLVDKAEIVIDDLKFDRYREDLSSLIVNNPINFYNWFLKLKELANKDEELFKKLDKKLFVQLYNKSGFAILPEYKFIDFKKIKDLGLLRRVKRYNGFLSNPEASGIRAAFEKVKQATFSLPQLTVAKLKEINNRTLKKITKAYYKKYIQVVKAQYAIDRSTSKGTYGPMIFKRKGLKGAFAHTKSQEEGATTVFKKFNHGVKIFNIINTVSHKQDLISHLVKDLEKINLKVPKNSGLFILTPIFIEDNWIKVKESIQEYTLKSSINLDDDEYLFLVRKWVKKNSLKITKDQLAYNKDLPDSDKIALEFIENKKPRRITILKQYAILEKLYPTRPWMRKSNPDMIDRKGRAQYFDEESGKKLSRKFKSFLRHLGKTETYTSLIAGTTVLIFSGGNVSLSMSARSIVKNAVYTAKHDKEWKEFLKTAPADIISAFLYGSGFTAGRLYKILALGSAQGALQSLVTGQDIKTGAFVGAGMNLINYYVLPYSLAKPMTKGFDAESLRMNRLLEIAGTTVKSSIHGSIVATLTGEDPLKGALKGAMFGTVSSSLAIWFLGTRYYPLKDYSDEDLDAMIAAENDFQNVHGRGGDFKIDRQLILDSNYRVNGVLPNMISASITLPGNVSMHSNHFEKLTVLTHEAHHLMQQHQSGVFGFYLFRYIPTSFLTGYKGHPDENFLRDFLHEFLHP